MVNLHTMIFYTDTVRHALNVFKLLVGTMVAIGVSYLGYHMFLSNSSLIKFILGLPVLLIGFGFVANNTVVLMSIILGSKGSIRGRMRDNLYSHDD